MDNFVLILTGVILVLVGLGFVIAALVNNRKVRAAESWPTIPGTVLKSGVKEYTSRSGGVTSTSYEPVVNYQYALMGKTFEGKRLGFGATRVKFQEAQDITNKYLAGTQVIVHYNPNKPEESVLEVAAKSSKAFLIIGAIAIGLGLILLILKLI